MLIGINQSLLYYRFSNVYTSLTLFLHFLKTSRSFKPRWMFLNQREKSIFQPPTITCVRFSTSNRKTRYPAPLNYRNRANYPPTQTILVLIRRGTWFWSTSPTNACGTPLVSLRSPATDALPCRRQSPSSGPKDSSCRTPPA